MIMPGRRSAVADELNNFNWLSHADIVLENGSYMVYGEHPDFVWWT